MRKTAFLLLVCGMIFLISPSSLASSSTTAMTEYEVAVENDNIVTLPVSNQYVVLTREYEQDVLDLLGLTKDDAESMFENATIFLDAIDIDTRNEITLKSFSDQSSIEIGSLSSLFDEIEDPEEIEDIISANLESSLPDGVSIVKTDTYIGGTIPFIRIEYDFGGNYGLQYFTVENSTNIMLILYAYPDPTQADINSLEYMAHNMRIESSNSTAAGEQPSGEDFIIPIPSLSPEQEQELNDIVEEQNQRDEVIENVTQRTSAISDGAANRSAVPAIITVLIVGVIGALIGGAINAGKKRKERRRQNKIADVRQDAAVKEQAQSTPIVPDESLRDPNQPDTKVREEERLGTTDGIDGEAKQSSPEFFDDVHKIKSEALKDPAELNIGIADEIRKYKELMDDGIITPKEFEEKKQQLLKHP